MAISSLSYFKHSIKNILSKLKHGSLNTFIYYESFDKTLRIIVIRLAKLKIYKKLCILNCITEYVNLIT